MIPSILLLLTLVAYSMIVSQSFMYILSLKDVQVQLEADSYTEIRKLIDISMRSKFKYVVYSSLLLSLALVILTTGYPTSLQFIMFLLAFLCLVIDTMITVKGNLPVNDVINKWSPGNIPANWKATRDEWFRFFQYRQIANITGFLCLLAGTIF